MSGMIRRYHVIAALALAIAALLVAFTAYRFATTLPRSGVGEALVGGPFTLTDHNGKRVSDADFRGRYLLVAFGYTYCPDLCPAELQVMSAALDRLGPAGDTITPIFVTIDPARDTVEVLKQYMGNFHPRFVGLTGSEEEIAAVAKAYRVYYAKSKDASAGDDYLMDHSTIIYLMGPDGKFVKHFTYGSDADALAEALRAATGS
jgi:protein SCO1/2